MIEYEDSQSKATILMEALPYVRRFRGSVFVVKYGGSFMDSQIQPSAPGNSRLGLSSFVGIKVVVVHGGGKPKNCKTRESKLHQWTACNRFPNH